MQIFSKASVSKGVKEKAIILDAIESALDAVSPSTMLSEIMKVKSGTIYVKGLHPLRISSFDKIIVVGGGKASGSLAESLERILGLENISGGYVNILKGTKHHYSTKKISLNEASHPVPNRDGVKGVRTMLSILKNATKDSLVICLITGGGSSILPLPAKGIALQEIVTTTDLLLRAGADIDQMNTVRKHISSIKGGQLLRYTNGARVLSLIISDVVGNHLDSIASGPTSPDKSTFSDAIEILDAFNISKQVPSSVLNRLKQGANGALQETPKPGDSIFSNVSNILIGSNEIACKAAIKRLEKDFPKNVYYLGSSWKGEARDTYQRIISKCVRLSKAKRSAFVWGGETTVTVRGEGIGGRNQEQALAAFRDICKSQDKITIAFFATDGIDGKTNAAGAIVDRSLCDKARSMKLDPERFLEKNDSNTFFQKIGHSLIRTGPTGTNVNDLGVAILN
ncbi:MAG: glycerate kinase type-2 family protein [Nitrososphaerales archaeon]